MNEEEDNYEEEEGFEGFDDGRNDEEDDEWGFKFWFIIYANRL